MNLNLENVQPLKKVSDSTKQFMKIKIKEWKLSVWERERDQRVISCDEQPHTSPIRCLTNALKRMRTVNITQTEMDGLNKGGEKQEEEWREGGGSERDWCWPIYRWLVCRFPGHYWSEANIDLNAINKHLNTLFMQADSAKKQRTPRNALVGVI